MHLPSIRDYRTGDLQLNIEMMNISNEQYIIKFIDLIRIPYQACHSPVQGVVGQNIAIDRRWHITWKYNFSV